MNIKEFTSYMLEKYNVEILDQYFDSRHSKKNKIKDKNKFEVIKNIVPKIFKVENLITTFKPGQGYNFSESPWIQIHDKNNKKGTVGFYLGISFNKEDKLLELWVGFGNTYLKKKEVLAKREEYITNFKKIEPMLKRGFKYSSNKFNDATVISKNIPVQSIVNEEIEKDLDYLGSIYLKYINKPVLSTQQNEHNIYYEQIESPLPKAKKIEGKNEIYIGPPGCGKSYEVMKKYLANKDDNGEIIYNDDNTVQKIDNRLYEVVTFHPEYTASNFIGSVMPITNNDEIKYDFVPGPFAKILKRALHHPQSNFYLIIEEINRGDTSAIFGDIFVLLDRVQQNIGESMYEISYDLLANYIYNDPDKKIKIPSNLSIIATMNSTDQNTIPLDSAFKRRWEKVWILDDDESKDKQPKNDQLYIKGYGELTWKKFRTAVNNKILETQNHIYNFEDKTLAAYFINESYLSEKPSNSVLERERFANNILTYLFLDVCKYDKSILFKEDINCISTLIKKAKADKFSPFNDDIVRELH